jgi:MFS transporter, AAHS family, 4-hydroxybenzoate transporter
MIELPPVTVPTRVALLCGLVVVLEGYDLSALGYVVPVLSETWRIPPVAFTAALTAGNAGMFFGAVFCGWLGDRIGRKPVLLGCVAVFGAASVLTAFVTAPAQLTIARLITGIGLGGGVPTCIALVSDFADRRRQGALVMAMIAGLVTGNLAAGIVAVPLLASYGWPSIFIVGGVLPLVFIPLLVVLLPESPAFLRVAGVQTARAGRSGFVAALFAGGLSAPTLLLWMINFVNLLTIYFVNSWLPSILRSLGASTQGAIIATSMFHVGAILAAFVTGGAVTRYGIERVLRVSLAFGGLCILLAGWLDLPVFALGCFILGFGFGTNGGQLMITALPGAIYEPAIRGTGAGWATGIGRLGNISGALLGGLLLSLGWSPKQMLLALAIAPFVNAALATALGKVREGRGAIVAVTSPNPQFPTPKARFGEHPS